MTRSKVHQPYLVKKRIKSGQNLWGIIADIDGEDQRIEISDLLGLMAKGYQFLVDVNHTDRPSLLTAVHALTPRGGAYYFRTVGDSSKFNNFNEVKEIKLITAKTKSRSCKLT